jgi:CBS-domain-containing membrane protein
MRLGTFPRTGGFAGHGPTRSRTCAMPCQNKSVRYGRAPTTTGASNLRLDRIQYCFETDDSDEIAQNMADIKLRRLPVLNAKKRMVGIISLADIAITRARRPGSLRDFRTGRRALAIYGRTGRNRAIGLSTLQTTRSTSWERQ